MLDTKVRLYRVLIYKSTTNFLKKEEKKEEKMIFLGDIIMEVFLWKIKKVRCL